MCSDLQRYLRDNGTPALNIFTKPTFKYFQNCLDAEMKRLTKVGVGSSVNEVRPFSEEHENKLWDLWLLGDHSAKVLLNIMVFLMGKNFALSNSREHRSLKFSQFTLVEANERKSEKLIDTSFGENRTLCN